MNLQVLVSTMHQASNDYSLLDKMNIQSDAIVINQCDRNHFEKLNYKGHAILYLSFNERGVGLSRNNALMRATADICLFADDDVRYVDGYHEIVMREYKEHPDADVIVFNVPSTNPERGTPEIKKWHRLRFYNCLRYGTCQFSIRTKSIHKANIYFSLLFGGGARYSAGEDSLFVMDCIRKGLKVYASPLIIGTVTQNESTWFRGYNDKYFIDKGALYEAMTPTYSKLMSLQFCLRHRNMFKKDKKWWEAFNLMLRGINEYKEQ